VVNEADAGVRGGLHFTVGSLRYTSRRAGGVDFRGELGLLKAALLYADHVELCSVGASFMSSLDELGKLPTLEKLALMRRLMPIVQPDATDRELANVYRLIDSMVRKLRQRRRLTSDETRLRMFLEEKWREIERLVESTFDKWGAEDFRVAQRSGLLELRPFATTSPDALLEIGMSEGTSATDFFADQAYEEYRTTILEAVGDGNTYPLFDDLTGGDVVARAVSEGLIRPSPGAKRRGKHGGLSGDLLQRLPLFEKASVSDVLDVREELFEYLGAIREAVSTSAATIESASWEVDKFAEEAELVFRENVAPAVDRIEERVMADRSLKELNYRYGPSLLAGASSMGALLAGGPALAALAALTAGLSAGVQALAARRSEHKELEGEHHYFYYRAGRSIGRRR
jgi:hypothetical protein